MRYNASVSSIQNGMRIVMRCVDEKDTALSAGEKQSASHKMGRAAWERQLAAVRMVQKDSDSIG